MKEQTIAILNKTTLDNKEEFFSVVYIQLTENQQNILNGLLSEWASGSTSGTLNEVLEELKEDYK